MIGFWFPSNPACHSSAPLTAASLGHMHEGIPVVVDQSILLSREARIRDHLCKGGWKNRNGPILRFYHFLGKYEPKFSITNGFGITAVRLYRKEKLCRVLIDVQLSMKLQKVGYYY